LFITTKLKFSSI